ncbi:S-layer homology domain-containing protein [Pseudoflavonifractor phocaeensis]|uniref:S-layer homology domain-containing protein n=1 Tax=Pseudoflavonifractor phocaeensis TaxID=1870988 RepID=UPI0019566453|nr:S-layer homology domain-containing protein [Pseudoflavonifractor phocaeensis]
MAEHRPEENGRIYCGAFAGTYLDNEGKNPPTVSGCTFTGQLYSGPEKNDILEAGRYVGSLWYGAQPPSTVKIENCTISMPPVAQVGGETYATLAEACEAAQQGADKTVTLLADVAGDNWTTIGLTGLTVEGGGHVLTVDKQAFRSGGGNTFRDLTLDLTGASGGYALNAKPGDVFSDVTILGNSSVLYGILIGGTEAGNESVIIEGCTFDGMQNAIYDSESGEVENLIVKNSTFQGGARFIFRSPQGRFTGNTLDGVKLNIMKEGQTVAGNTFLNGSRISFYVDGSVFQDNQIRSESYLEFTGADGQNRDLRGNDFGEEIIVTTEVAAVAVTLPASAKPGSAFAGWSDGEGLWQAGDTCSVTEGVTFTAQWTEAPPSGGGAVSGNKTETVTNPDGSTTTTVTRPNGTVTETTTDTDGNKTQTVTNTDGSATTTVDQDGRSQTQVKLPAGLVDAARENGETVALPMPGVSAAADKTSAPVVKVELPADTAAKVEIPVENMTPGTVAVIVREDGTEEIIKTSLSTGTGVAVTLSDGDTVKIVDNSKNFDDVADDHWGADAVTFATSRELFQGTSATTFSPEQDMTRAMIVTVLARYEGVSTEGDLWYEAGQRWAVERGISDGSNMDASVSLEQLAVMLWRCAGSPAASGGLDFADGDSVSHWAAEAMAWAVENGLIQGLGEGVLAPQGQATRAQVAAILARFVQHTHV